MEAVALDGLEVLLKPLAKANPKAKERAKRAILSATGHHVGLADLPAMEEVARDFRTQVNGAWAQLLSEPLAGDVLPQRHYRIFFRT